MLLHKLVWNEGELTMGAAIYQLSKLAEIGAERYEKRICLCRHPIMNDIGVRRDVVQSGWSQWGAWH